MKFPAPALQTGSDELNSVPTKEEDQRDSYRVCHAIHGGAGRGGDAETRMGQGAAEEGEEMKKRGREQGRGGDKEG
jgi:hypothetical protein